MPNPRSSSYRDIARHPSLTLRQLERQFLIQQPTVQDAQAAAESNRTSIAKSPPLTINTSFSSPVNLTKIRLDSSSSRDESSPHVLSLFSPPPTVRSEATITPRLAPKTHEIILNDVQTKPISLPTSSATGGIEFRLNKSSIDLSNVTSTRTDRKSIIIPDLNPNSEQKESKYRFPDSHIATIRRRSSSANPLKIGLLHVD